MNPPAWSDLAAAFHDVTLERALDYVRRGRVLGTSTTDNGADGQTVAAEVAGTDAAPYRVRIELQRRGGRLDAIESACTCPVGYNCKHGAAALMVAFGLRATAAPVTASASSPAPARVPNRSASPPPALPQREAAEAGLGVHADWLSFLRGPQGNAARQIAAAHRKQRMVYVIGIAPHGVQPTVELLYANVRKNGSLSPLLPTNPSLTEILRTRPRYVGPDDPPLLTALTQATAPGSARPRVLERDGGLLTRLVEQGEALVLAPDEAGYLRLKMGSPRPAVGGWRVDTRGRQHFDLLADPPARALALEGLWYLDASSGELGVLQPDVDAAIAEVLLKAPPIGRAETAAVAAELQRTLDALPAGTRRPPPLVPIVVRKVQAAGVVHVRLGNAQIVETWRRQSTRLAAIAALVHVRYDDVPAALDDRGGVRLHDGALVDLTVEAKRQEATGQQLQAAGLWPMPEHAEAQPHESAFSLDETNALALMNEHVPRWREAGWVIDLAPDFAWQMVEPGTFFIDAGAQTDNDWFGLELGVEVDGQKLSLIPLIANLLQQAEVRDWLLAPGKGAERSVNVRLDERRVVRLPAARVRQILATLIELHGRAPGEAGSTLRLPRTDAARVSELAAAGFEWRGSPALRDLGQRLASFTGIEEVAAPAGLRAELRPYQRAGLAWLQFLRGFGLAGILADDMGLGKTVQTIAHLLVELEAGRLARPALVVAPTSVVPNWQHELARFAPGLRVLVLHGKDRHAAFDEIGAHHVVLTTYPLLPRDIDELAKHEFHVVVFDEAQNLKNARTRSAAAAGRLRAGSRLALTGTPLENNLAELWSQFNLLLPGLLGDSRRFAKLYRTPIEKHGDDARRAHLARRIKPFVLRRTKDLVARELPPKTEIDQSVELSGGQRDLYETIRASMEQRVREALARQGLARSHIVVLDALLKLRQVCCDPRLLAGKAGARVKESAKLSRLTELLPELVAEGRRILLFSQFTSMLALIEIELARLHIDYVQITGSTRDRKTPVARFQRGEVPLFLISLKAGGTGLNLTAADTVIHYDPWWNPAVENQATDRAHRIGQDKPVFVHRLIAAGTVEERIRALQVRKADLARGILDEDAALAKALDASDMQALFEPLPA